MRELRPWQVRSNGRDAWRAYYAGYMKSPAWFARRVRWVEEELALIPEHLEQNIHCIGCNTDWSLKRDDLHHVTYDNLGNEEHDDLWPMCRACHSWVHEVMESTRTWRRVARRLANELALNALHEALDAETRKDGLGGANAIWRYL